jgi:hypothetical protein
MRARPARRFLFRLAGHLGKTVAEIEDTMSGAELLEWMEYENIEPFGAWRDNWHTSIIASILANANRKSGSAPIKMADFMYVDSETTKERRDAEMLAFLEGKVRG